MVAAPLPLDDADRLLRRVAREFRGLLPVEDLCQSGRIGLMKAESHYDPKKGSSEAFAKACARSEMRDEIRRTARLVRVPKHAWKDHAGTVPRPGPLPTAGQFIPADRRPGPLERIVADEELTRIRDALERIDPESRRAVMETIERDGNVSDRPETPFAARRRKSLADGGIACLRLLLRDDRN